MRGARRNKSRLFQYAALGALPLIGACRDAGTVVPENPTFSDHVAPILHRECGACHRPNGPAPFSLLSYDDARTRSGLIAAAVRERRMPPWLPETTDHAFSNERRLSDAEIRVLERWAEQGAAPGDTLLVTAPAIPSGWTLGEPDLVVELAEAYPLSGQTGDVFRNFVIPTGVTTTRYVRAVDLHPGDPTVVHHAVIAVDSTDASRQEDEADEAPGFDGMFSRRAAKAPSGFFVGWTPGRVPQPNPEGLAWALHPGTDAVLQLHLRTHGHATQVRPRIAFYFADAPPTRSPVLLRLGAQTIDIPPGHADYTITDSLQLPVDVDLLSIYPHAHYLAKTMQVEARLPGRGVQHLLRIDDWDFNWQDAYDYKEPVALPAGTMVSVRYVYDNSAANPRNPSKPPKRVVYGPHSTDEMAELWIQAVPQNESDLSALQREVNRKALGDAVQGWQHLVQTNPNDAVAHANLGAFYNSAGDVGKAVESYQQAIRAQPDFAGAHYNLGLIFERRGELERAIAEYRAALRTRANHAGTHNNLGNALLARGDRAQAAIHFRKAIELQPAAAEAHNNLGRFYYDAGQPDSAIVYYRRAAELAPTSAAPRFNLALALASRARTMEALATFEQAARIQPNALEGYTSLAWLLATHRNPSVRHPDQAIELVNRALRIYGQPHPRLLDVLAASHAAAGRYDEAVKVAQDALQRATAAGQGDFALRIGERLQLYLKRQPYIETSR